MHWWTCTDGCHYKSLLLLMVVVVRRRYAVWHLAADCAHGCPRPRHRLWRHTCRVQDQASSRRWAWWGSWTHGPVKHKGRCRALDWRPRLLLHWLKGLLLLHWLNRWLMLVLLVGELLLFVYCMWLLHLIRWRQRWQGGGQFIAIPGRSLLLKPCHVILHDSLEGLIIGRRPRRERGRCIHLICWRQGRRLLQVPITASIATASIATASIATAIAAGAVAASGTTLTVCLIQLLRWQWWLVGIIVFVYAACWVVV